MSDELSHRRGLESLKKEAKRWLKALDAGDQDARARLERALTDAPPDPTLRDVQLALARENGFAGWAELKAATLADENAGVRERSRYEVMAQALLDAYRTGTPDAMERHYQFTWHRRAWQGMRTYVQLDLGKRPARPGDDVDITLDDARYLVAIENGFDDWSDLCRRVGRSSPDELISVRPVRLRHGAGDEAPTVLESRNWHGVIDRLRREPSLRLDAEGQMTDEVLALIADVDGITSLALGGSKALTDDGIRHLARMPHLKHLDLRETAITDAGLAVLRDLPQLESISLAQTRVTDEGVEHLRTCQELERVDLAWTRTGDRALAILSDKRKLCHFSSGHSVTDAGIRHLHDWPVFKNWQGREPEIGLMRYSAAPNSLSLRGAITDRGLDAMRGLDGLFALNLNDSAMQITPRGLESLVALPHLGFLAVDAKDDWMPVIARMPALRMLGAQDTSASDDGFVALSRSATLEYLWGRRCHGLGDRGFKALATMPKLTGLSVSCLNVGDDAIAALPSFPALRELMPMDIPDAGYRHIGRCENLESLILMYCRDTTDAATEQIVGLKKLSYYFNSYTTITDRTPALLSTMDSLERITFDACHGLTDDGVGRLARLPNLRELRVAGRQLTRGVAAAFPPTVAVHWSH